MNALHATIARLTRRSVPHLWGDGLVEQSMSCWYSTRIWDDVDDDELVVFMPALIRQRSAYCSVLSDRRVQLLSGCLSLAVDDCVDAQSVGPKGGESHSDLFAVARINRALLRVMDSGAQPSFGQTIDLNEGLLLSILTRLNAAYVYAELDWAADVFSAGAWLGHVMQGRPALLPPFIAEALLNHRTDDVTKLTRGRRPVGPAEILALGSSCVPGGYRSLMRTCERVVKKNFAARVSPTSRSDRLRVFERQIGRLMQASQDQSCQPMSQLLHKH